MHTESCLPPSLTDLRSQRAMPNENETQNCSKDFRYPLFSVTYSMVFAVGLPLNAAGLWIFIRRLGLHTVPVIYMANLAMSDLLFTLSLPLRIIYFITARWHFGNTACRIPGMLFSVSLYSSSLFIMLISVDRLLALVYPLRSRALRTPTFAWLTCGLVWGIIMALSVPVAINHRATWDNNCNVLRCFEHYGKEEWTMGFYILLVVTVMGIAIPFTVILGCTLTVIRKLRTISCTMMNKNQVICIFMGNLFIYSICFIPFHVAFILFGLQKVKWVSWTTDFFFAQTITMCLASTNSCLDPLIYYITTKQIKRNNKTEATMMTTMT
nr:lysophosphatidic acid receptor 6-like [Paramormyrops kingsleyae]